MHALCAPTPAATPRAMSLPLDCGLHFFGSGKVLVTIFNSCTGHDSPRTGRPPPASFTRVATTTASRNPSRRRTASLPRSSGPRSLSHVRANKRWAAVIKYASVKAARFAFFFPAFFFSPLAHKMHIALTTFYRRSACFQASKRSDDVLNNPLCSNCFCDRFNKGCEKNGQLRFCVQKERCCTEQYRRGETRDMHDKAIKPPAWFATLHRERGKGRKHEQKRRTCPRK